MALYENLKSFNNKSVVDFKSDTGIESHDNVYRLRSDYDQTDGSTKSLLEKFCSDPKVSDTKELVIGLWDFEGGSSGEIIQVLIENKDKLAGLSHLMLGDITGEENEISWIEQEDVSGVISAFPNLVHFQVRGGNGLGFSNLSHDKLKTIIVETGGLSTSILNQLLKGKLPDLEHFEVWTGDENYGFDGKAEDFNDLYAGTLFPKLRNLGLKNSAIADELAIALNNAPILDRIETLDLSMGTMTDTGGQALLENGKLKNLSIKLHHHFLSEDMEANLKMHFGDKISIDGREEPEDYGDGEIYRYVEVSE